MQNISYNDSGDGYPIILLHGFCESKNLWEVFVAMLSIKYRVISIDLPGFGQSKMLDSSEPSIELFSESVFSLLKELEIQECIMIGHSFGGYVTLSFAESHPEMLGGFSLFHSTSYEDSTQKKENRDKAVNFIQNHGTEKFVTNLFPALFSSKNTNKYKKQIEYFIRDASQTPEEAVIFTTKAMKNRPDRRHVLKEATCPVFFIVGKDDASLPLQQSLEESSLPKESLVFILENVGHMGMIEATQKCILQAGYFIEYCLNKKR